MYAFWIGLISVAGILHAIDIRRILQTPSLGAGSRTLQATPLISVLIPARNEAARIGTCLAGLAAQSYRAFEVIVIDDHSTDSTAESVQAYCDRIPQLSVVSSEPLPPGWAGKNWACWQAAQQAHGDWLLFLDADVIPRPELLSALIEASAESDLVSLLPLMLLGTSAERLILPAFLELLAAIYPFKRVNRHSSPLAFAIGQCLMIRRGAYNAIDGHAAVRASVLEDMQLARQAKQAGLRLQVAEASDLLAVRMYLGWSSLTEGLAKNAVAGARHSGMRVALIATQRLVLGWLPVQILMLGWLTNEPLTTDAWLACGALLLLHMLVSGWIVLHRFRIHASWGVLLPLGTLIYFLIAAYGFIRIWLGIGVRWKGRVLETRD